MSTPIIETLVPEGILVDRFQLFAAGVNRTTIDYWLRKHQLQQVTRGVYRRPGSAFQWECVVHSLLGMGVACRVAARSALWWHGLVVEQSTPPEIILARLVPLPGWLKRLESIARFRPWHGRPFESLSDSAVTSFSFGTQNRSIPISTPELALLEWLVEIHNETEFQLVDHVFSSGYRWDIKRLKNLLTICPHQKARQLCLWFAEHNHLDLNLPNLDLGCGKIAIVKNGVFDKKYRMTVPRI